MTGARPLAFSLVSALVLAGCHASEGPKSVAGAAPSHEVRLAKDRPPVAIVSRDGDPRGALAVAVWTAGLEGGRDAEVATALAGLVEGRLEAAGIADSSVVPGWDGYRVRVLVDPADVPSVLRALRQALTTPVEADGPGLRAARKKLAALANRPLPDPALLEAARCTGELYGSPAGPASPSAIGAGEIETLRRAAHGTGRVAFAAVGVEPIGEAAAAFIAQGDAWPEAAPLVPSRLPAADAPTEVYDASGLLAPGGARVTLAAYTASPAQAVAAAYTVGDPRGPLASRLGALDAPGRLRTVTAAAHAAGGCLAVSFDLAPRELGVDASGRIATATALARQELSVELGEVTPQANVAGELALGAGDPRDAAERAAFWVLTRSREGDPGDVRVAVAIGLAGDRDAGNLDGTSPAPPGRGLHVDGTSPAPPGRGLHLDGTSPAPPGRGLHLDGTSPAPPGRGLHVDGTSPAPPGRGLHVDGTSPAPPGRGLHVNERSEAIRSDLDRATALWRVPVVEARSRVERGQGELWVVAVSPCGTAGENDGDAGLGATVATAMAEQAARARSVRDRLTVVEPLVLPDALGLVVHGPAAPGESPPAHARRLADIAGRSLAADPLDVALITKERTALFSRAGQPEGRMASALASALSPGHPSGVAPFGTADALARVSEASALAFLQGLRAGPVRVAVLANADAAQARVAVRAVDRWVARRVGESRSCAFAQPNPPRPGTYAVDAAGPAGAEAVLAVPLPVDDKDARLQATFTAAALDGPGGLLARALGDSALARSFGATVGGGPKAPALLLRIASSNASLDDAVAQTRALLDRLRQGAMGEADRARAVTSVAHEELARALDPRSRLLVLLRGEPSQPAAAPTLEALRAFAATALKDDALVIVAARPSRGPGQ